MFFDLISALCSLLSTYYFIRMNNKAWGIGMIATCLNGGLYWYSGIYADMVLEAFYFFTMAYGWYKWQEYENKGHHTLKLKKLSSAQSVVLLSLFLIIFIFIYATLITLTQSNIPALDALTTTLSLVAQWLMCHKIILAWGFWFITDAFYVWLYLTKNLPFHALLMFIYTGMAVMGYLVWTQAARIKEDESRLKNFSV
ncbi:nicotinamide riboside transporter PnuC [Legionella sp. km772]|uniref:nicotinamide riboside transporter PnuC n=1 Tax=Legionella sp. km772 TaxID=2498111 RepID=UPI000F8E8835|nr:nicotinamide riboside transporter PnuC [Legionella sp. km772]RUR08703.1 nicotinamide riboside transporter PnuC [Legionella sp. km772]